MTPQQQAVEDDLDARTLKTFTQIANLPRPIEFRITLGLAFLRDMGARA